MNKNFLKLMIVLTLAFVPLAAAWADGQDFTAHQKNKNSNSDFLTFSTTCCQKERDFVWKDKNLDETQKAQRELSPNRGDPEVGIFQVDLNDDGKIDFLAQVYSFLDCGSHGCRTFMYLNYGQNYKEILLNIISYDKIKKGKKINLGMHDLCFMGAKGECLLWRWDGKKYYFYNN